MITLKQIQTAHSKVKSGADFPAYIQELKLLGLSSYTVMVNDGSSFYKENSGKEILSEAKYDELKLASEANPLQFKSNLKAHQQGKTDYLQFCMDCANSGIEKWIVSLEEMTCSYFDIDGQLVLIETIPA